jgi:hypothetical protein
MRYLVTTKSYIFRKYLDNFLNMLFPNKWVPLYSMVTFSRTRYSQVIEKRKQQDRILNIAGNVSLGILTSLAAVGASWALINKKNQTILI